MCASPKSVLRGALQRLVLFSSKVLNEGYTVFQYFKPELVIVGAVQRITKPVLLNFILFLSSLIEVCFTMICKVNCFFNGGKWKWYNGCFCLTNKVFIGNDYFHNVVGRLWRDFVSKDYAAAITASTDAAGRGGVPVYFCEFSTKSEKVIAEQWKVYQGRFWWVLFCYCPVGTKCVLWWSAR